MNIYEKKVYANSSDSVIVDIYRNSEQVCSKYFNPVNINPPIIGLFISIALGETWIMPKLFKKAHRWGDEQIEIYGKYETKKDQK